MTLFKIIISNRSYSSWEIVEANTLEPVSIDLIVNPIEHKLFPNDVFTFNKNTVEICHSSIRIIDNIPGVLILRIIKHMVATKAKMVNYFTNVFLTILAFQHS
jgi:hypothetical protein